MPLNAMRPAPSGDLHVAAECPGIAGLLVRMQIERSETLAQILKRADRRAGADGQVCAKRRDFPAQACQTIMEEMPVAARDIGKIPVIRLDDEKRQNWLPGANRRVKRGMVGETQVALEPDDLSARRSHALYDFVAKRHYMARVFEVVHPRANEMAGKIGFDGKSFC